MNLYAKLAARADAGAPIRVGLIGAGKFGSMFISQVQHTPGMHLLGIADLDPDRARRACRSVGWPAERCTAKTPVEAIAAGTTWVTDDAAELIAVSGLDVIIEATGVPEAGIRHALAAFEHGRHVGHGQCRGRRPGRAAAGQAGRGRRRGLRHGLRRPAGADLRAGRLGRGPAG